MNIEKLQILSQHYSYTFDILQIYLKRRDKLFGWAIILLAIMLFYIYNPVEVSNVFSQIIEKKLNIKTDIDLLYIQSIIWFFLLTIIIKYFQAVILIERQYDYIHSLEELLSSEYEGKAFTREGKSYLNDYPVFLNWASFLYTILFPALLALITTSKIVIECKQYGMTKLQVLFDILIFVFIIISLGLYLYGIHFKSTRKQQRKQ